MPIYYWSFMKSLLANTFVNYCPSIHTLTHHSHHHTGDRQPFTFIHTYIHTLHATIPHYRQAATHSTQYTPPHKARVHIRTVAMKCDVSRFLNIIAERVNDSICITFTSHFHHTQDSVIFPYMQIVVCKAPTSDPYTYGLYRNLRIHIHFKHRHFMWHDTKFAEYYKRCSRWHSWRKWKTESMMSLWLLPNIFRKL